MPELTEEQRAALALEDQNPPITDPNSQNPPTNPPTNVITQEQLQATHNLYGEALREQTQRAENLQRQLDAANNNRNQPQQVPDDQLTPQELIRRQIDASVAPILSEFALFRQQNQLGVYQTLKGNFSKLPQIAPYWAQLEPYVDKEMQGKEPTIQNLQDAVAKVIGLAMLQGNNGNGNNGNQQPVNNNQQQNFNQPQNQQPQNNQNRNDQMLPPHLRPSNPPAPNRNDSRPQLRQLTELEKRVARERGMSDADYLAWIDVDPTQVVRSKIGIPEPTK